MNKIKKLPKSGKLKSECTRVIKTALSSNVIMQLKNSELNNFFDEKSNCKLQKIQYNDENDLKLVKSLIKNKLKNKNKVIAIMKGTKNTTLDHLNSIWNIILKNSKNISWAYYVSNRKNNCLYLLSY